MTKATGTMRAARLHHGANGGTELRLDTDVAVPVPGPGEVLVRVRACGLNQVDLLTKDGQTPQDVALPHISGTEVAGDVAAVGPDVADWEIGARVVVDPIIACRHCDNCVRGETNMCRNSRVFGVQTPGGYAEYAVAPARQLLELPEALDYAAAAAMAVTGPTAWHMLRDRAKVVLGEDVLIIAAGSGIGVLGMQIAAAAGARVIATAGGPDKVRRTLEVGADFAVDHNDPSWPDQVRRFTGGRGVDIVFEHVGAATWEGSLKALARGGRLVTCGGHSGFQVGFNLWHLFVKEQTLIGSFGGTRRDFLEVMKMGGAGRLRQVVQDRFSLADVPKAQELLRQRKVFGKLILDPTLP
ncbi:zinc-binding dehydrogenase [Pseudohoeflea coraliihabitans]|uniref:Alcohol dehydrogenase catalytic domain-containing protein n=1 Tax=Pseudohoeflea coraliihabitans TaxID=2860393 RepID=A0ABS6WJZ8_9HYPH|nr:alcohol dehydrogenase catalytic domain-containing protein [Pseudohoeflea sp. DP4N28-3]MBW3095973.1 alcohol dehydrogenase catalytic domain-containing protein [Pseudohoeflea sp. DP4N28-3]